MTARESTPYNGVYGGASAGGVISLYRLKLYERVGISLVEV